MGIANQFTDPTKIRKAYDTLRRNLGGSDLEAAELLWRGFAYLQSERQPLLEENRWLRKCADVQPPSDVVPGRLGADSVSHDRLHAVCEEILAKVTVVQDIPPGLVDSKKLAKYVPKSEKTLRQWAEKGIIPAIRIKAGEKGENVTLLFDAKQVIASLKANG